MLMSNTRLGLGYACGGFILLMAGHVAAATATWTNTADGTVDSWVNTANWNASTYPGQDGANQGAFLTNRVSSVYKAVVSTSLTNTLGTLQVQNLAAGGQAWVVVTNATMSATGILIRTQGRFEIDNGATVSGAAVTLDWTNGQLVVGSGGTLSCATNLYVGSALGMSNTLTMGDNSTLLFAPGSSLQPNVVGGYGNQIYIPGNNVRIMNQIGSYVGNALVTGNGGVWDCGSTSYRLNINGSSNLFMVSQGGLTVTNCNGFWVGYGSGYNQVVVTNGGRFTVRCGIPVGYSVGGNRIIVTGIGSLLEGSGSQIKLPDSGGGITSGSTNNQMLVDQGGVVSNAYFSVGLAGPSLGNAVTITNGSRWYTLGAAPTVGSWGTNNVAVVTGSGSLLDLGGFQLAVGAAVTNNISLAGTNNLLLVDRGAMITNGSVLVGGTNSTVANTFRVLNGSTASLGSLLVGVGNSSNNIATILTGSLLEVAALSNGSYAAGNVITNDGSILQFTVANPSIVPNGNGGIAVNNGTLAYRGVTSGALPNLTNNWGATGLGAIVWSGANTFRLNNAAASNTVAGGYVFDTGRGSTNYVRLEMLNGSMLYGGAGITIGAGGTAGLTNGVLEAAAINNQSAAAITNAGSGLISAGYQFTNVSPNITVGNGLALQNGVLSYRAVTNADVHANQAGWPGANGTVNMALLGSNGFELNASTNSTASDQTYTFSASLGATNFAGLAMVNGVTRYRNGNVTIAPDGWLFISNTVASFDRAVTNLGQAATVNSTATYSGPYVTTNGAFNQAVNSTVTYNGGLQTLGGAITNWIINGTLAGTNYAVGNGDLLGFGATGASGTGTNASVGFQVLAGGTMWASNNTYVYFNVPLTNAGTVLVSAGGALRLGQIANAAGVISNNAGLFEFTTNLPTIITAAGAIVLNNGGIGYVGVTNADVKAHLSGYAGANATTNIVLSGTNYFRLNAGGNRGDVDQTYVFDTGRGSTNFNGLALLNASTYRGGAIAIGTGGWMTVSGASTLAATPALTNQGAVTIASGATLNGNLISNRTVTVLGSGASWNQGGNSISFPNCPPGSQSLLTINAGAFNNAGAITMTCPAGAVGLLTVTNGGLLSGTAGQAITIGSTAASVGNTVLVTGPGSLLNGIGAPLYLGNTAGATGNVLRIDNAGTASNFSFSIGSTTGSFNSLIVTNGGKLVTTGGSTSSVIGNSGSNNLVAVSGANSIWTHAGGTGSYPIIGNNGGSYNTVRIENGAVFTNATGTQFYVGNSGSAIGNALVIDAGAFYYGSEFLIGKAATCTGNSVRVINGGLLLDSGSSGQPNSIGGPASGCSMLVDGIGSVWMAGSQAINVGYNGASANSNTLTIANGGVLTNAGTISVGSTGVIGNQLRVTGGGLCALNSGAFVYIGLGTLSNLVWVSGAGSTLASGGGNGNLYVGGATTSTGNVLVVDNGAACLGWSQLILGRNNSCSYNTVIITNGGCLQVGSVRQPLQASNSWYNTIQIGSSGILEANSIKLDESPTGGSLGNNCITNAGGIYQFPLAAPTIAPDRPNNSLIYLASGTIAFRAVTNVDVKGNWSGTDLTNINFSGNNGFRLNSATNAASPDQSYTFASGAGYGPTNYARLELFNGSLYRGGSVTIGPGGTLAISGTASAISNVTFSGGSLEVTLNGTGSAGTLNAVGSVSLTGGSLNVILAGSPPPAGWSTTLISKSSSGSISGKLNGSSTASYRGTNYLFHVDSSSGSTVVLTSAGKVVVGTALMFQ